MPFSGILGHNDIIANLRSMIDAGRLPHAVMFSEKEGCGALGLALAAIEYLFGKKISPLTHPDVHFVFPINTSSKIGSDKRGDVEQFYPAWRELVKENPYFGEQQMYKAFGIDNKLGTISVAEANAIIRKLSLSSYEGGAKVMLIMFPERMNIEAANKLLKNLEEPGEGTWYFLITHNPEKIIPTITSRCRIIEVAPLEPSIIKEELKRKFPISEEEALFWARCSGGSIGKAMALVASDMEQEGNGPIFISILEKALEKDLAALMEIWEEIASYGKEQQKGVCIAGSEILRKIYMMSLGMEEISYVSARERERFRNLSGRIKKDFYHKGYGYLGNALECIERNVNPKFIFCDLCNRIFYNI